MIDNIRSGDLIFVSGKGLCSWGIQLGTLSAPNVGPLGRWGLAGASHVGVACTVWDQLLIYESTSFARPPCQRTGRENPTGVQAHRLDDILVAGGDVWHFPLRAPLYDDEEIRLLNVLESYLGRPYDMVGAGKSGGGLVMRTVQRVLGSEDMSNIFCSELAVDVLCTVGRMQHRNAGAWSPMRLLRYVYRHGVTKSGVLLN